MHNARASLFVYSRKNDTRSQIVPSKYMTLQKLLADLFPRNTKPIQPSLMNAKHFSSSLFCPPKKQTKNNQPK